MKDALIDALWAEHTDLPSSSDIRFDAAASLERMLECITFNQKLSEIEPLQPCIAAWGELYNRTALMYQIAYSKAEFSLDKIEVDEKSAKKASAYLRNLTFSWAADHQWQLRIEYQEQCENCFLSNIVTDFIKMDENTAAFSNIKDCLLELFMISMKLRCKPVAQKS